MAEKATMRPVENKSEVDLLTHNRDFYKKVIELIEEAETVEAGTMQAGFVMLVTDKAVGATIGGFAEDLVKGFLYLLDNEDAASYALLEAVKRYIDSKQG